MYTIAAENSEQINDRQSQSASPDQLSSAELQRAVQSAFIIGQWIEFYRQQATWSGNYNAQVVEKIAPIKPTLGEIAMGIFSHNVLGIPNKEKPVTVEERERQLRQAEAELAGELNYGPGHQFFMDKANKETARWGYDQHLLFDTFRDGTISKLVDGRRMLASAEETAALGQAARQTGKFLCREIYSDLAAKYPAPIVDDMPA